MTTIGQNIERLCRSRGLAPSTLARQIGMAPSTLLRLISGEAKTARNSTLVAIAAALGVALDALTGESSIKINESILPKGGVLDSEKLNPLIFAKGDALAPEIRDGDSLSTEDVSSPDEVKSGAFVVAIPKGSDTPVVRKLIKGDTACYLTVTNPDWPDKTPIEAEKILSVVTSRTTYFK